MGMIQIKGKTFSFTCGFESRIRLPAGLMNRYFISQELLDDMILKLDSGDLTLIYDEQPEIVSTS